MCAQKMKRKVKCKSTYENYTSSCCSHLPTPSLTPPLSLKNKLELNTGGAQLLLQYYKPKVSRLWKGHQVETVGLGIPKTNPHFPTPELS